MKCTRCIAGSILLFAVVIFACGAPVGVPMGQAIDPEHPEAPAASIPTLAERAQEWATVTAALSAMEAIAADGLTSYAQTAIARGEVSPTPPPTWAVTFTAPEVLDAFHAAGLQAENPAPMQETDYGSIPQKCDGTRFDIPAVGEYVQGWLYICHEPLDQVLLHQYFDWSNQHESAFFTWVFAKGNVVLQLSGSVPESTARQYEAALP